MAAATTLAKVLRGGRSGLSSRLMLPAIGRGVPQEAMPNPAVGMGRLMHTGQWRNPVLPAGGGSVKAPRKVEQFCSKRFLRSGPDAVSAMYAPVAVASMLGAIMTLPTIYRQTKVLFTLYKK